MKELTTGDSFKTIESWLHKNLKENKSFVPCKDSIHNPKSKKEVSSKGLYFWFIHPNGYDKLNKIIPLESILENRFTKKINGIDYDLVYVGTAGVRNNKNGVNNGNLFERFNWHIKNNQTLNSLKNNSISTLRRTIIPLFSDDLFKNESQQELNQLFKKYFHLFYLDYGTEFLEVKDLIKSDETILITKLKPIFNLKENNNTQNSNHITAEIQIRRINIEKATKKRLGFRKTKVKKSTMQTRTKMNKTDKKIQIPNMEIKDKCFENIFTNAEEIHQFARKTKFKEGKWTFKIFETKKPGNIISPYSGCRTESPSDYIGRVDTNKKRKIDGRVPYRWEIIEKEMIDMKIEKITVKACPFIEIKK